MTVLRRSQPSRGETGRFSGAYRFPRAVSIVATCIVVLVSISDLVDYLNEIVSVGSASAALGLVLGVAGGALVWWFPKVGAVLGWVSIIASGIVTKSLGTVVLAFVGVTIAVTATATMRFVIANLAVLVVEIAAISVRWPNLPNLFWQWTLFLGIGAGMGFVVRAVLQAADQRRTQAIAMKRVQREAEEARRKERESIAHDMHDYVAHELTLIVTSLTVARAEDRENPETVHRSERDQNLLDLVSDESHKALDELRGVLRVLKEEVGQGAEPPEPGVSAVEGPRQEDLSQVVEAAARDLRLVGDDVDVATSKADGVSPELSADCRELFRRFMTEGATNALKHGGRGARVWIEVSGADDAVHAGITNTMAGEPVPKGESTGMGLAGLRSRAEAAGGSFTAGPRKRDGVEVWSLGITLPYFASSTPDSGRPGAARPTP